METMDITNEQTQPEKGAPLADTGMEAAENATPETVVNAELVVKASPTEDLKFTDVSNVHPKEPKTRNNL